VVDATDVITTSSYPVDVVVYFDRDDDVIPLALNHKGCHRAYKALVIHFVVTVEAHAV
jgi:hypothetical protein